MHYRICIRGHLDSSWQERFAGLRLEPQEAGTTLLSGELPDQAALHGVLLQITRLSLVLLSLETSEAPGGQETTDAGHGKRTTNQKKMVHVVGPSRN